MIGFVFFFDWVLLAHEELIWDGPQELFRLANSPPVLSVQFIAFQSIHVWIIAFLKC